MTEQEGVPIPVEVAYALPDRQVILSVHVPSGTSALQAARHCGIEKEFQGLDVAECKLGVFGKLVAPDYVLRPGERVEIYRPLLADPKEVRRQLAAQGKSMGQHADGSLDLDQPLKSRKQPF